MLAKLQSRILGLDKYFVSGQGKVSASAASKKLSATNAALQPSLLAGTPFTFGESSLSFEAALSFNEAAPISFISPGLSLEIEISVPNALSDNALEVAKQWTELKQGRVQAKVKAASQPTYKDSMLKVLQGRLVGELQSRVEVNIKALRLRFKYGSRSRVELRCASLEAERGQDGKVLVKALDMAVDFPDAPKAVGAGGLVPLLEGLSLRGSFEAAEGLKNWHLEVLKQSDAGVSVGVSAASVRLLRQYVEGYLCAMAAGVHLMSLVLEEDGATTAAPTPDEYMKLLMTPENSRDAKADRRRRWIEAVAPEEWLSKCQIIVEQRKPDLKKLKKDDDGLSLLGMFEEAAHVEESDQKIDISVQVPSCAMVFHGSDSVSKPRLLTSMDQLEVHVSAIMPGAVVQLSEKAVPLREVRVKTTLAKLRWQLASHSRHAVDLMVFESSAASQASRGYHSPPDSSRTESTTGKALSVDVKSSWSESAQSIAQPQDVAVRLVLAPLEFALREQEVRDVFQLLIDLATEAVRLEDVSLLRGASSDRQPLLLMPNGTLANSAGARTGSWGMHGPDLVLSFSGGSPAERLKSTSQGWSFRSAGSEAGSFGLADFAAENPPSWWRSLFTSKQSEEVFYEPEDEEGEVDKGAGSVSPKPTTLASDFTLKLDLDLSAPVVQWDFTDGSSVASSQRRQRLTVRFGRVLLRTASEPQGEAARDTARLPDAETIKMSIFACSCIFEEAGISLCSVVQGATSFTAGFEEAGVGHILQIGRVRLQSKKYAQAAGSVRMEGGEVEGALHPHVCSRVGELVSSVSRLVDVMMTSTKELLAVARKSGDETSASLEEKPSPSQSPAPAASLADTAAQDSSSAGKSVLARPDEFLPEEPADMSRAIDVSVHLQVARLRLIDPQADFCAEGAESSFACFELKKVEGKASQFKDDSNTDRTRMVTELSLGTLSFKLHSDSTDASRGRQLLAAPRSVDSETRLFRTRQVFPATGGDKATTVPIEVGAVFAQVAVLYRQYDIDRLTEFAMVLLAAYQATAPASLPANTQAVPEALGARLEQVQVQAPAARVACWIGAPKVYLATDPRARKGTLNLPQVGSTSAASWGADERGGTLAVNPKTNEWDFTKAADEELLVIDLGYVTLRWPSQKGDMSTMTVALSSLGILSETLEAARSSVLQSNGKEESTIGVVANASWKDAGATIDAKLTPSTGEQMNLVLSRPQVTSMLDVVAENICYKTLQGGSASSQPAQQNEAARSRLARSTTREQVGGSSSSSSSSFKVNFACPATLAVAVGFTESSPVAALLLRGASFDMDSSSHQLKVLCEQILVEDTRTESRNRDKLLLDSSKFRVVHDSRDPQTQRISVSMESPKVQLLPQLAMDLTTWANSAWLQSVFNAASKAQEPGSAAPGVTRPSMGGTQAPVTARTLTPARPISTSAEVATQQVMTPVAPRALARSQTVALDTAPRTPAPRSQATALEVPSLVVDVALPNAAFRIPVKWEAQKDYFEFCGRFVAKVDLKSGGVIDLRDICLEDCKLGRAAANITQATLSDEFRIDARGSLSTKEREDNITQTSIKIDHLQIRPFNLRLSTKDAPALAEAFSELARMDGMTAEPKEEGLRRQPRMNEIQSALQLELNASIGAPTDDVSQPLQLDILDMEDVRTVLNVKVDMPKLHFELDKLGTMSSMMKADLKSVKFSVSSLNSRAYAMEPLLVCLMDLGYETSSRQGGPANSKITISTGDRDVQLVVTSDFLRLSARLGREVAAAMEAKPYDYGSMLTATNLTQIDCRLTTPSGDVTHDLLGGAVSCDGLRGSSCKELCVQVTGTNSSLRVPLPRDLSSPWAGQLEHAGKTLAIQLSMPHPPRHQLLLTFPFCLVNKTDLQLQVRCLDSEGRPLEMQGPMYATSSSAMCSTAAAEEVQADSQRGDLRASDVQAVDETMLRLEAQKVVTLPWRLSSGGTIAKVQIRPEVESGAEFTWSEPFQVQEGQEAKALVKCFRNDRPAKALGFPQNCFIHLSMPCENQRCFVYIEAPLILKNACPCPISCLFDPSTHTEQLGVELSRLRSSARGRVYDGLGGTFNVPADGAGVEERPVRLDASHQLWYEINGRRNSIRLPLGTNAVSLTRERRMLRWHCCRISVNPSAHIPTAVAPQQVCARFHTGMDVFSVKLQTNGGTSTPAMEGSPESAWSLPVCLRGIPEGDASSPGSLEIPVEIPASSGLAGAGFTLIARYCTYPRREVVIFPRNLFMDGSGPDAVSCLAVPRRAAARGSAIGDCRIPKLGAGIEILPDIAPDMQDAARGAGELENLERKVSLCPAASSDPDKVRTFAVPLHGTFNEIVLADGKKCVLRTDHLSTSTTLGGASSLITAVPAVVGCNLSEADVGIQAVAANAGSSAQVEGIQWLSPQSKPTPRPLWMQENARQMRLVLKNAAGELTRSEPFDADRSDAGSAWPFYFKDFSHTSWRGLLCVRIDEEVGSTIVTVVGGGAKCHTLENKHPDLLVALPSSQSPDSAASWGADPVAFGSLDPRSRKTTLTLTRSDGSGTLETSVDVSLEEPGTQEVRAHGDALTASVQVSTTDRVAAVLVKPLKAAHTGSSSIQLKLRSFTVALIGWEDAHIRRHVAALSLDEVKLHVDLDGSNEEVDLKVKGCQVDVCPQGMPSQADVFFASLTQGFWNRRANFLEWQSTRNCQSHLLKLVRCKAALGPAEATVTVPAIQVLKQFAEEIAGPIGLPAQALEDRLATLPVEVPPAAKQRLHIEQLELGALSIGVWCNLHLPDAWFLPDAARIAIQVSALGTDTLIVQGAKVRVGAHQLAGGGGGTLIGSLGSVIDTALKAYLPRLRGSLPSIIANSNLALGGIVGFQWWSKLCGCERRQRVQQPRPEICTINACRAVESVQQHEVSVDVLMSEDDIGASQSGRRLSSAGNTPSGQRPSVHSGREPLLASEAR